MIKLVALMISLACVACPAARAMDSKNSYDLIEAARKAGTITDAQATLYNALSSRRAPALPEAYRGDPKAKQVNTTPDHLYAAKLIGAFPNLALNEQKQALQLMAPPAYVWSPKKPDSEIDNDGDDDDDALPRPNPDPSWITVENSDVKVWYRKGDANGPSFAKMLAAAYGGIRDRLVGLMERGPLPDDDESHTYTTKDGTKYEIGNGGNGKMDIYLLPCPAGTDFYAYAMPYLSPSKPNPTPAFIVFDSAQAMDEDRLKTNLAHELMHTVQFAFPRLTPQLESYKINEGVAKWTEEFMYPAKQYAHEWPEFSMYGWTSLLDDSYATWTFYYFLQHELGASTLKMIYENMASNHPYDAINSTITGGFKKQWPLYTVKEWNQASGIESFWEWDKYGFTPQEAKDKPVMAQPMTIGAIGDFVDRREFEMLPLTRRYLFYEVDTKTKARSIAIEMGHYFQLDKIFLKALVKYEGSNTWKIEDWNKQMEDKELCLDMTNEHVEKFVLIYSNFDYKDAEPVKVNTVVKTTNIGCYGYKGRIKGHVKGNGQTLDMDTDAVFKVVPRIHKEPDDDGHMPGRFDLASVKIGYTYSGTLSGCTALKAGTVEDAGPELRKSGSLSMYPYHDSYNPNGRQYSGQVQHPRGHKIPVTYHCPNGQTFEWQITLWPWLLGTNGMGTTHIPGGTGILSDKGAVVAPVTGAGDVSYDYTLTPFTQDD